MAINFPPNAANNCAPVSDGERFTDPTTGRVWEYKQSIPAWVAVNPEPAGDGAIVYRGPISLLVDPLLQYSNIVAGNVFTITVGDPNDPSPLYPGLTGDQSDLGQIIYDGSVYTRTTTVVPEATEVLSGQIRVATQAEVDSGSNVVAAVTPSKLDSVLQDKFELPSGTAGQFLANNGQFADLPTGDLNQLGVVQLASQADVNAGTSESLVVSAKVLADSLPGSVANPIGSIIMYAGSTPPQNYLECNGAPISQATYPELHTLIGELYGPEEVSGDRILPDLRGMFTRGWDHGRGIDAGRALGSQQDDATAVNGLVDTGHSHPFDVELRSGASSQISRAGSLTTTTFTGQGFANLSGDSETRPVNVALMYIIKAL